MSLDAYLKSLPGRCQDCGHHPATQGHGADCTPIAPTDEWRVFTTAVREAVRDDGTVHQCDVRPLIRGRIAPKRIGLSWRKARTSGLLVEAGHERSDDERGKNAGRMEPYYRLGAAA